MDVNAVAGKTCGCQKLQFSCTAMCSPCHGDVLMCNKNMYQKIDVYLFFVTSINCLCEACVCVCVCWGGGVG